MIADRMNSREVEADDAGQDRHHLDRRQMGEARGDQHQQDEAGARRDAQRLELVELAVEFQHRPGHRLVGVVAEEPAGDAAQHRGGGGDERIAVGAVRPRQRHRQEQHVGRDEEDRAFDEGDEGQPVFGGFARRKRQGPVVKSSKHRRPRCGPGVFRKIFRMHNGAHRLHGQWMLDRPRAENRDRRQIAGELTAGCLSV